MMKEEFEELTRVSNLHDEAYRDAEDVYNFLSDMGQGEFAQYWKEMHTGGTSLDDFFKELADKVRQTEKRLEQMRESTRVLDRRMRDMAADLLKMEYCSPEINRICAKYLGSVHLLHLKLKEGLRNQLTDGELDWLANMMLENGEV